MSYSEWVDRAKIVAHANEYWYRPCMDGVVCVAGAAYVRVDDVALRRRLGALPTVNPGGRKVTWKPCFLNYGGNCSIDGLYFVDDDVKLDGVRYDADSIHPAQRILVQPWEGLNDCAHFVSECLSCGAGPFNEVGVGALVGKLKSRKDVKVLGEFLPYEAAERIVAAGIMKEGDVIAFGAKNRSYAEHGHSVVYLGDNRVANHSHLNHTRYNCKVSGCGQGQWEQYTAEATGHPLVTLLHFATGDSMHGRWYYGGWWQVNYGGTVFYYYFEQLNGGDPGRCWWVRSRPPSVDCRDPPLRFDGVGYWFQDHNNISVCWQGTGTVDVLQMNYNDGHTLSGRSNSVNWIKAVRLP